MRSTWFWMWFAVLVLFVALSGPALAFQRMGVIAGTSVSIPPPNAHDELPAFCLDQDAPAPTTEDSFVQVLNAENLAAIEVETEGKTLSLEEAIDKGIVSISGVSRPSGAGEDAYTRFDAVRVSNLTSGSVNVRVNTPVVLGGKSDPGERDNVLTTPLPFDVSRLLDVGETQLSVWVKLQTCKEKAEAKKLSGEAVNAFMDDCLKQGDP